MGSHSWIIKAGFAVAVHVLSLMTSSQVILDDPLFFCDSTENVTSDCCLPCFNVTCNSTCPEGQLTLNFTRDFPTCVYSDDVNATSSEETSRDFVVVCVDTCPVTYYSDGGFCTKCDDVCDSCSGPGITDNCTCTVRDNGRCVASCQTGSYNNNGNCAKCDDACKSCNGSGREIDTCVCKFEFNGTCYESCQSNLTECEDGGDDESNSNTIIIAAAVGGGVAVIVIIVIIVIVLKCCRRGNKKTRMSAIIERRDDVKQQEEEETGIQLPTMAKGRKPGKYENVNVLGGAVSTQAQDTQDKMTRYAKDPTLPRGKSLQDQPDKRESGLYANAESIQLQRELAGEAGITKQKRGVFSKFKQSVKYVSRKSKKKGANSNDISGSQNPVFEEPQSGDSGHEDYVDMSGKQKEEEEQEDYVQLNQRQDDEPQEAYEPFQNTGSNPSDEPQEEYENFGHTSRIQNEDEEPQDEYENFGAVPNVNIADSEPQDDYENFGNTSKVNVPDDEPQDEYENFRPLSTNEESPYINVTHFRKEK